jgi:hypothetical protein
VNYKVISGTCAYQNWLVSVTIGTVVPVTQEINNLVINYGTDTCFNATQTITVAGSGNYFTVQPGGSARLIAGMNIFLLPGTIVHSGSYLLGTITQNAQYCTPTLSPLKSLLEQEATPGLTPELFAVSLYPNPASDHIILDLSQAGPGDVVVSFTGIDGRTRSGNAWAGGMKHKLDVSSLDPGVYVVRISDGNRISTLRLVKI